VFHRDRFGGAILLLNLREWGASEETSSIQEIFFDSFSSGSLVGRFNRKVLLRENRSKTVDHFTVRKQRHLFKVANDDNDDRWVDSKMTLTQINCQTNRCRKEWNLKNKHGETECNLTETTAIQNSNSNRRTYRRNRKNTKSYWNSNSETPRKAPFWEKTVDYSAVRGQRRRFKTVNDKGTFMKIDNDGVSRKSKDSNGEQRVKLKIATNTNPDTDYRNDRRNDCQHLKITRPQFPSGSLVGRFNRKVLLRENRLKTFNRKVLLRENRSKTVDYFTVREQRHLIIKVTNDSKMTTIPIDLDHLMKTDRRSRTRISIQNPTAIAVR